jgi:hypothetical protein
MILSDLRLGKTLESIRQRAQRTAHAFTFPSESRPTDCLKSSFWNSPLPLKPPPHTPVPDIHWIAKHERTTSDNAFHPSELALADSIFRDAALSKGTMKPYSPYAALLALANDR